VESILQLYWPMTARVRQLPTRFFADKNKSLIALNLQITIARQRIDMRPAPVGDLRRK